MAKAAKVGNVAKAAQPGATTALSPKSGMNVLGSTGLIHYSGYINEEFQKELAGTSGVRKYREMADNDPTIGALLYSIEMLMRAAEWKVEPAKGEGDNFASAAEAEAEFLEGALFRDMSHSWEDFIAEAMSFLTYGWAYFETVYKIRRGPDETDPSYRSEFTDGRVGFRKVQIRSQDSLSRWEMQDDGGIAGMWQLPPDKSTEVFIPINKALLFRPRAHKGSPEGRSMLRTAYKPYYFLNRLQDVEAIGAERELTGLPIVRIPTALIASTDPEDQAIVRKYQKVARDLRFNTQGGLVIPSDPFDGPNGPSNVKQIDIELLASAGTRTMDVDKTISRYQTDIARSVLAEFLMLGSGTTGSFALSNDKTDLFVRSIWTLGKGIASVFNRHATPRLWRLNALDRSLMPTVTMGQIGPEDLEKLGTFLKQISDAGAPLFPDINLEQALRRLAKVPEKTPEIIAEQEAAQQAEADAAAAEAAARAKQPMVQPAKPAKKAVEKMTPRTLYVSRRVLNPADISAWARSLGIEPVTPDDEMHVTVTYSRSKIDWNVIGAPSHEYIEVMAGGARALELLGQSGEYLALAFSSPLLEQRHTQILNAGGTWDWAEYQPHITIQTGFAGELPVGEVYQGRILLGPEVFEEINEEWLPTVPED